MSDGFLGEIRLFSFGILPDGWVRCEGQMLPVQQNAALFSLLGTQFGGNGSTTFGLPDLRSRVPFGLGTTSPDPRQGTSGGTENVALNNTNAPPHIHAMVGMNTNGTAPAPTGNYLADPVSTTPSSTTVFNVYSSSGTPDTALNAASVTMAGGGQAHSNMQPFATAYYCIATQGIYPPRT